MLRDREPIPALRIRDYPDTAFRLCYIGGGDRLTKGIRQQIDRAFYYKLNMLVLENGGFYHLDDPKAATGVREVFDYCRRIGIEPIPELQSFGWAHFILPIDPTCVEATPYKNRLFKFGSDDIAVHQLERASSGVEIKNPGLAEGEGHRFEGWEQDDVGRTIFADEREPGNRCLRITRAAPGMSRIWRTVACESHTDYSLEVDMRTEAGEGFAAYFEVYSDKGLFKSHAWIKQTTDWQRRRIMFYTGEGAKLTIYLRVQEGVGQAWFDNVTCRPGSAFPMINVIRAPHLPVEVKSGDGKGTFKEGADYEIVPGDFGYPFKGEAKPWQIRRTPSGRIQPGQLVRVSYHWAKPGAITYCPSEPRTHQIVKRTVQQTIRLLRPRFLHIGHDEPRVINVDARCRQRNLKAHELFAEDVKRLYGYAKEADPAVRLMMWADALRLRYGKVQIAWHSKEICTLEDAVRGIPKDVMMCRWMYGSDKRPVDTQVTSLCDFTTPLLAAGYDVTVSPWYDLVNAYCWGRATKCMRDSERRKPSQPGKCLGLFLTTWHNRWQALPLCADLMWTLSSPSLAQVNDPERLRRTLKEYRRTEK